MLLEKREIKSDGFQKFICRVCGYIYDEAVGEPSYGIAPGTRFADISDDWVCAMCGEPKSEFQLLNKASVTATTTSRNDSTKDHVIIIGAGLAGWTAAAEIRSASADIPISLVTMDSGDYYYKPSLSIAWSAGVTTQKLVLEPGSEKASKLDVQLVNYTQVVGIDRHKKQLITDGGFFPYGRLIIATGSKPRKLTQLPRPRIYSVNSLDEFAALESALAEYQELVIVGGGLIGCEIADDLSHLKKRITIVNQGSQLLSGVAPSLIADALQAHLSRNGLCVKNNVQIASINTSSDGRLSCLLNDGSYVKADALVSCIGLQANAAMAKLADLTVTHLGLQTDTAMRTNDPNIFALGDCVDADGVALRYVDAITAQAKVIAEQFRPQPSHLAFAPTRSLVKIKTRSYPIWISHTVNAHPYTGWRVIAQQDDHFHLELLQGDTPCGYALSGMFTNSPDMSLISSQFLGEIQ